MVPEISPLTPPPGDVCDGHVLFLAIGDAVGGFRGEAEERLDRLAGAVAGAGFEEMAEQDEHGDDGGGFEVEARGVAQSDALELAGQNRCERFASLEERESKARRAAIDGQDRKRLALRVHDFGVGGQLPWAS